jgi:hypothetical protein
MPLPFYFTSRLGLGSACHHYDEAHYQRSNNSKHPKIILIYPLEGPDYKAHSYPWLSNS